MIFNPINLTLNHQTLILNDLHILPLTGNMTKLRQNDPMLKDVCLLATTCLNANMITPNFPNSASHEDKALSFLVVWLL